MFSIININYMTIKMTIDIPEDFKNKIKGHAYSHGQKLKDFVLESLQMRIIEEENEDRLLGDLAIKCEAGGFVSDVESQKLTDKLKQCLN